MNNRFKKYWNLLFWKFKISQLASLLLLAGVVTLGTIGVVSLMQIKWPHEFTPAYFILFVSIFSIWSSLWTFSETSLKERMHRLYPELEHSLQLFLEANPSALAEIQKENVIRKLPTLYKVPVEENWWKLSLVAIIGIIVFFAGTNNFKEEQITTQIPQEFTIVDTLRTIKNEQFIKGKTDIVITPPPYTRLKKRSWQKDIKIPEGSKLTFTVNGGNAVPHLIQQGDDTLSFRFDKQEWSREFWLNHVMAFQLYFQKEDSIKNEELMVFEILKDEKPIIITDLDANRKVIAWEQLNNTFDMQLQLQDDYGLQAAHVVATLSKGDGESVKFRELKWSLPQFQQGLKKQNIAYELRLDTLGLDPGDELYFYFRVADNKYPENQSTKSEVFFIEIADTVQQESVAFEGLALSTEPEFFKSQRQIIIDTEKLIKDQNNLSRDEFEDKSDEIGADQKLLRLRYGIFLGEEYEVKGGLGESAGVDADHTGHEHEGEEHDHESHAGHDHEEGGVQPNGRNFSSDLYNSPELEAYVHSHDNTEIATFFDAEVKQKLKQALANMWDAELYLRTYRPKLALPFEYKALELIKEVQRASRIYVERMGFEPPPLEPVKKRLTGKLTAIEAKTDFNTVESDPFLNDLRTITEEMKLLSKSADQTNQVNLIQELSDLLIAEMVKNPVRYAQILAEINQYKQSPSQQTFNRLIEMTEQILPLPEQELSGVQTNKLHLKSIFHQQLEPK